MKAIRTHIVETIQADPVAVRTPYLSELGGEHFCVFQAEAIAVGTDMQHDRPAGLTVLLYVRGRDRNGIGRSVEFRPSVDHARSLAAQLMTFADEVEATAREQASEALRKAAGR